MATSWNKRANLKGPKGDKGDGPTAGELQAAVAAYLNANPVQRGTQFSSGNGAPASTAGFIAGDQYLDLDTGDLYRFE